MRRQSSKANNAQHNQQHYNNVAFVSYRIVSFFIGTQCQLFVQVSCNTASRPPLLPSSFRSSFMESTAIDCRRRRRRRRKRNLSPSFHCSHSARVSNQIRKDSISSLIPAITFELGCSQLSSGSYWQFSLFLFHIPFLQRLQSTATRPGGDSEAISAKYSALHHIKRAIKKVKSACRSPPPSPPPLLLLPLVYRFNDHSIPVTPDISNEKTRHLKKTNERTADCLLLCGFPKNLPEQ